MARGVGEHDLVALQELAKEMPGIVDDLKELLRVQVQLRAQEHYIRHLEQERDAGIAHLEDTRETLDAAVVSLARFLRLPVNGADPIAILRDIDTVVRTRLACGAPWDGKDGPPCLALAGHDGDHEDPVCF